MYIKLSIEVGHSKDEHDTTSTAQFYLVDGFTRPVRRMTLRFCPPKIKTK